MNAFDFLRIINEGYERINVEYKRSHEWSGEFRFKLIKAVMAMANLGGGYLVIGYDESIKDTDKRFIGVSENDLPTWDVTNVNRDINNYCEPSIDIEVIQVPDKSRNVTFVVVRVPSHKSIPYICKKDKNDISGNLLLRRGALYYRNKNKECVEISDIRDWHDLIRRCTMTKREEFLRDISQIIKGPDIFSTEISERDVNPFKEMDVFAKNALEFEREDIKSLVFWELICYPLKSDKEIDIELVKKALLDACYDYQGWPFVFFMPNSKVPPQYGNNIIYACSNELFYGRAKFNYWVFDYERAIFYSKNLTTESSLRKPKVIDPRKQAPLIGEALLAMGRLFFGMGLPLDEMCKFALRYSHIKGAQVTSLDESRFHPYPSDEFMDNEVRIVIKEMLSIFLNSPSEKAAEIVMDLIRKMGYDHGFNAEELVRITKDRLSKGQKVSRAVS